jgi:hypothetical protein
MAKVDNIAEEIEALKTTGTGQLLVQYKELFGDKAASENRVFLVRQLAYRIQERAMGGILGRKVSLVYGRKCFFKKACPEPDFR